MKNIGLTYEEKDFLKLKNAKSRKEIELNKSPIWEEFFLLLARENGRKD